MLNNNEHENKKKFECTSTNNHQTLNCQKNNSPFFGQQNKSSDETVGKASTGVGAMCNPNTMKNRVGKSNIDKARDLEQNGRLRKYIIQHVRNKSTTVYNDNAWTIATSEE